MKSVGIAPQERLGYIVYQAQQKKVDGGPPSAERQDGSGGGRDGYSRHHSDQAIAFKILSEKTIAVFVEDERHGVFGNKGAEQALQQALGTKQLTEDEIKGLLGRPSTTQQEEVVSSPAKNEPSPYVTFSQPSPKETADVIVGFATGFFELFVKNHPEMSDQEALREFDQLIRKSIKRGALEALDVIRGLHRDTGDTLEDLKKSLDFVERGLQAFMEAKGKKNPTEAAPAQEGAMPTAPATIEPSPELRLDILV